MAALLFAGQAPAPAPPPAPADQVPTFSTGTSQVRLDVQVSTGKDLITGLKQDDFLVFDEGAPEPITYFGRDAEHLRLLLLLDVSGSMRKNLQPMAATARQALHYLHYKDRVGIMLFSRETKVLLDFTADMDEAARQLREAVESDQGIGSGTAINRSILSACGYMESYAAKVDDPKQQQERRAILIVTDNLSLNYKASDEQVLRALYGNDTVFNAIVFGRAERPLPPPPGTQLNPDYTPADVFRLAEETGGEAVKAARADATFAEMMERIRTRYSLSYKPPEAKAGAFRHVRVELSPAARRAWPNAVLRYRSGYYAGG